ncbi:uncharacterized protein rod [Battus philenor]|uniref:uncharacterized protein rod n=1 Tax=Battus philenor TaxID=42288 RepID=UPI0035CF77CD
MSALTVVQTFIKTVTVSESINDLKVHFIFPKLVIIEDKRKIIIVDITHEIGDEVNKTGVFELKYDVTDGVLQDHFLWLTVTSNEFYVVNVFKNILIKISSDNYANYDIQHIVKEGNNLVLISKSGECLAAPFTTEELDNKIKSGEKEITVTLEKLNVCRFVSKPQFNMTLLNGINAYLDVGKIILECIITGTKDVLHANIHLEYMVPWGNAVVLGNKNNMWIHDLNDFKTTFEFPNVESKYYPVAATNETLYYLLWDEDKIQVYSASISQAQHDSLELSSGDVKTSKYSQDALKIQLNTVIESALSNVKPGQVLPQLHTLFNSITDYDFLINAAIKLCQQNILYKAIVYPLQTKIFNENNKHLINLINDLSNKIDLLEYIMFRGDNLYADCNLFEKNFIQLCILFISKSDLDLATICWLKYSELKLGFEHNDILSILKAIPCNIKMGALVIWLHNFVTSVLEENPFYIDLFVKWTTERVFYLEQSPYWPKIGLKFIQEVIIVLENSVKTISIRPTSLDDLDVLKGHINYVIELKEKYKINMMLSELSAQHPTEVALIMLRRCYTEDLRDFLQNNLPSYASRYLFEIDDILYSFIESEATFSGGSVDGVRLQMLLNAFRSVSRKLDCLLQVLKVLDVPWDNIILDIAVTAAASATKDFTVTDTDKILAQEIHNEINYAKVKVLLKKYNFPLTCTNYNLVLHKITDATSVDVNDLKVITGNLPTYANISHILYIDKCLQNCETKQALNYFKELSSKEKRILLKTMINKYELIVVSGTCNNVLERNYLDFLKATQLVDNIQMKAMENLYYLKNSYDITLSINEMYIENCIADKVDIWIQNNGYSISSDFGRCLLQLTNKDWLRKTPLALLRRSSTSQKVREVIECMLTCKSNNLVMISIFKSFKDGNNSKLLIECSNILSELASNCDEECIHFLMNKISMLNSLINTNIVLKNLSVAWKFHYIFLPITSVGALNDLIDFYDEIFSDQMNLENEISYIANRNDFIPFRIISFLLTVSFESKMNLFDDVLNTRDRLVKKLLAKITSSQELDSMLLTILLIIQSNFEDTDDKMWILETLRGQTETLTPSIMCYLSASVIKTVFGSSAMLPQQLITYPPKFILKSKFDIELSEVALPPGCEETWEAKIFLFHVLKQNPNTTMDRLFDLCRSLKVLFSEGLSLLLISILTNWDLRYKLSDNDLDCRELKLENNETELISKCSIIWESIDNKNLIKDVLSDFWKKGEVLLHGSVISINPYYYEVYSCIYYLLFGSRAELRINKEYLLLNFLKYYKRKGMPKQYEFEMFSVKGLFPEIGFHRLPFHLFMREDMWSHLKSEITLETYEKWLPIVAILSLDNDLQTAKDMICSNAVKQTMTTRTKCQDTDKNSKENELWRLTPQEEPLLRTAHKCVRHIANMEWAAACLFYVLQGCARGVDQVAAAHLCYQFSQHWAAQQPVNRAVRQMERLYSTLSTRHALHKICWTCEEFIRLSSEPTQLIQALYLHPQFIDKIALHDVNRAVNEIADKNNINISSIRIQILENILEKPQMDNNFSPGLNTRELITAKYILKATCPKMGAIYLSRIVFDDEYGFNKCKKLRAFQCLMSVVDPNTAVKVTNYERESLWCSLLELLYTVKLEKIDMPWVVATFVQDKTLAIRQLLQVASGNAEGLKIAAELARRYGDAKIIHDLIPLLLQASLHEEIIPLLLKSFYPLDDVISTAWRAVMLTPFQRADYPITERQRKKCINVLNLLPVCPLIKDEDLVEIWKNCIRCKCLGLGCLVLPYMSAQTRQKLTEIQKIDKRNLVIGLKNLQTESYLVSGAMVVVENMGSKPYR